jgi:hypothetical protein
MATAAAEPQARLGTLHQLLEVGEPMPAAIGPPRRPHRGGAGRPRQWGARRAAPRRALHGVDPHPASAPTGVPPSPPLSHPQATHDGYVAAEAARAVTEVDVAGAGRRLSAWPPLLSSFARVSRLSIRGHFITALPSSVGNLVSLRVSGWWGAGGSSTHPQPRSPLGPAHLGIHPPRSQDLAPPVR